MKTQTKPKKRRPKNLERLYMAPIRSDGIMVVVEGGRSFSKQDILVRASVFLNMSDRIACNVCGRIYDGTNYFMVEYTGLLDRLRHAYCGDCKPEIKKLVDTIYSMV
jgi:hypothetical protein